VSLYNIVYSEEMIIIKKKKALTGLLIGSIALLSFTSGAIASSHLTKITAYLNTAISIDLKGKTLDLSKSQPITYNNTTYLPLRAIATATGLDVKWDQTNQNVSLTEKSALTPSEKQTFSKDSIEYQSNSSKDNLLLNPTNLPFIYKEIIIVDEINSTGKGFYLTFPERTTTVGVTFGSRVLVGDTTTISYKVYDNNNHVLSMGELNPNATTFVEFKLSNAGTKLKFEFEGRPSGKDSAYLIYDESWYQ
jgi:hypothetical protein